MKKLFILNIYETSKTNGIGTFIKQLTEHFGNNLNFDVNIVDLYSDSQMFRIKKEKYVNHILFPRFEYGACLNKINRVINTFFKLYIPDNDNNIFIYNESPCSDLMKMTKLSHPKSKHIYIFHNMGWTYYFKGDVYAFKKSFTSPNEPSIHISSIYKEEIEICKQADSIICLCEDAKELLLTSYFIDSTKIKCINNGINIKIDEHKDSTNIRNYLNVSPNEIILLFVGRLEHLKGAFELINAFKKVATKISNCQLIMVGPIQNQEELQNKIYPYSSRIRLTGILQKEELNNWYKISDIGIIPSYTEQCSYVGLEMLAHGLPIICSDGFGLRNMFGKEFDQATAKICDRKFPEQFTNNLASKIEEFILSKQIREHYRKMSSQLFHNKYTATIMRDQYLSLFEELTEN